MQIQDAQVPVERSGVLMAPNRQMPNDVMTVSHRPATDAERRATASLMFRDTDLMPLAKMVRHCNAVSTMRPSWPCRQATGQAWRDPIDLRREEFRP